MNLRLIWECVKRPLWTLCMLLSDQCMDPCGGHFDSPTRFCCCLGRIGHTDPHHCSHRRTWTDDDGHPTDESYREVRNDR